MNKAYRIKLYSNQEKWKAEVGTYTCTSEDRLNKYIEAAKLLNYEYEVDYVPILLLQKEKNGRRSAELTPIIVQDPAVVGRKIVEWVTEGYRVIIC